MCYRFIQRDSLPPARAARLSNRRAGTWRWSVIREHDTRRVDDGGGRNRGFTLIEFVIVMAVLGILTAIAVPAYREHVRKAARADAQSYLTDLATRQHQYLVDKRRYAATAATLNLTLPASIKNKFQDPIAVEAPDVAPPTFRLTATAEGDQTKDKCPTLVIDSAGNRQPAGCW